METTELYEYYRNAIKDIEKNGSLRFLKTAESRNGKHLKYRGKSYLNLSSNDYLGLACDRGLIRSFYRSLENDLDIIEALGPGSTSSRLLTGDFPACRELEEEIASGYNSLFNSGTNPREALVFNSGYHANVGIISALARKGDLILSDSLNHASIIDGIRLSGADCSVYRHLDYRHLEEILEKKRKDYRNVFIISESVFSMDGDTADLGMLSEIKMRYGTFLYVDEAHAVGVFGERGLGICERDRCADIDILMATFGKSFASMGSFALIHSTLKEYLVNCMRPLIFSTALPPVIINWNLHIFRKMAEFKKKREALLNNAYSLRGALKSRGLKTMGDSQIIPVITGTNENTAAVSEKLMENGYLLFPIRPPSVPRGSSRLRISLTSDITHEDVTDIPGIISGETSGENR